MWFWWILLASNTLYCLAMIICGWRMWKHCPVGTERKPGYRSGKTVYSKDIWAKVHAECGKRWWAIGWAMILPVAIGQYWVFGQTAEIIGILGLIYFVIECAAMVLTIMPSERRFHEIRLQENLGLSN